ncbi:DUF3800 domain-containing protein [Pasteurellaceae bacterium LIM206]|nr:DUF3800 domain-containing protein [Pasteurellaceae bacterium LIM206]
MAIYKIFCDESGHLEQNKLDAMVLGAICCSNEKSIELSKKIKWLRHKYQFRQEFKWTKLNKHYWELYKEVIDTILFDPDVNFKATVINEKNRLNHDIYNKDSHNLFYYKMFYYTLKNFLSEGNNYRVYLDYMDTLGSQRAKELCKVLMSEHYQQVNLSATIIRSEESQLLQVCDLLIGAVAYKNRDDIEHKSEIKKHFVHYLEEKLGYCLNASAPPWEKQFNIFCFQPRKENV